MKEKQLKQSNKRTIIKELMQGVVNREKEKIIHFGWDEIKVTDTQALEVIAKKYIDAGLDK